MKDDRALELIFATQVERFVKAAAYEAEPATWRAPAIREPSPAVRPAASPSLWEVTQPVFLRVPPAELSRERCTCIRCRVTGQWNRGDDGVWRKRKRRPRYLSAHARRYLLYTAMIAVYAGLLIIGLLIK